MRTVILKGSEWMRGKMCWDQASIEFARGDLKTLHNIGYLQSRLLVTRDEEHSGRMCCLGVDALACGLSKQIIANVSSPASISSDIPADSPYRSWLNPLNKPNLTSAGAEEAMVINDNPFISDEERVELLRPIFLRHDAILDWRPEE